MRKRFTVYNKTDHNLTGMFSCSYQNMTNKSLVGLLIINAYIVFIDKCTDFLKNLCIFRCTDCTLRIIYNTVCSSCVKTNYNFSVLISSDRILCFVAVIKRILHSYYRKNFTICYSTNSCQIVTDKLLFIFKLC